MPKNMIKPKPTLVAERALLLQGKRRIAGIDEVGVGAIAGPLIAATVILPLPKPGEDFDRELERLAELLTEVRDSKQVRTALTEHLDALIRELAEPLVGLGIVEVAELNELGNQQVATQLASKRALAMLPLPPDHVLYDGGVKPASEAIPWTCIPKVFNGTSSLSIAAASILAAVQRRILMRNVSKHYPVYGFHQHTGYPSPAHLAALADYGPCPLHHTHNKIIRSLVQPL